MENGLQKDKQILWFGPLKDMKLKAPMQNTQKKSY